MGIINNNVPQGVYKGLRAITTQSYTEANAKLGAEHEGATLLSNVAANGVNNTIFLTGAKTVALKGRIIGYTGKGVLAEIYELPQYTGGNSVPYQNASGINPQQGLTQILVGASITSDGILKFAPDYLIGNTSNQGKGTSGVILGREKLLKANTAYLFKITSLDSGVQDITSLLTWYEGPLDLPR